MRYFVTGCAGFIGSNLTDRLLQDGHEVIGYDNFSTGLHEFLSDAKKSPNFTLVENDLLNREALTKAMTKVDAVFHLAANADVRFGTDHPHKDLEQNTIATFNVLEAMRANNVKRIAFASTGSVYGEAAVIPTPENAPFPIQTSLYGASKVAAECMIQAYAEGFNYQAYIFRFVSILGERYTHGHVFDFYQQLLDDPTKLRVLGNGKQRKSYLYIQDCIDAIFWAMENTHEKVSIFNLGTDEYCEVNDSIGWMCNYLKLSPEKNYTGGERGWIGDNPFIFLDTARIRNLGWKPKLTIKQGIEKTIQYLHKNPWVLEQRQANAPLPKKDEIKVSVIGLWHLGCVTAACLAQAGFKVLGFDPNAETIAQLQQDQAPIFEPGLSELLTKNHASGNLRYSSTPADLSHADIAWITFDTDVDEDDMPNIESVTLKVEALLPSLQDNSLIIISSQLPVGTGRKLQQVAETKWPAKKLRFAYIPENLRLGKAIEVFTKTDRFVVGLQDQKDKQKIEKLLSPFSSYIIWMSIESAEMTKHALNAYLATSVVFINELATLCEQAGANAHEVEQGLKSEERIGAKAYLRPGGAIGGGTLLRDINYLMQLGETQNHPVPLLSSILESNRYHKSWVRRKISEMSAEFKNKTVAVLGLTYKVDTDTLRRSTAIETCQWLHEQGIKVKAYDPMISILPNDYALFIDLQKTIHETLSSVDAVLITTEWPEFRKLNADHFLATTDQTIVLDPNGFLRSALGQDNRIRYCSVGRIE